MILAATTATLPVARSMEVGWSSGDTGDQMKNPLRHQLPIKQSSKMQCKGACHNAPPKVGSANEGADKHTHTHIQHIALEHEVCSCKKSCIFPPRDFAKQQAASSQPGKERVLMLLLHQAQTFQLSLFLLDFDLSSLPPPSHKVLLLHK